MPLCSLYCNTLLANLNARAYIGGGETRNIVDMDFFTSYNSRLENTQTDQQNNTSGEATLVISQQVCVPMQLVELSYAHQMVVGSLEVYEGCDGFWCEQNEIGECMRLICFDNENPLYWLASLISPLFHWSSYILQDNLRSSWMYFMYISTRSLDFIYAHCSVACDPIC